MLELRGIAKRYGGLAVLSDVDIDVTVGARLGLIGPNGAGKTTLFNILSGFAVPNAGRVRFNDQDITRLAPEQRAALGIARTFQIVRPFGRLSVLENVMVGAFAVEASAGAARKCALTALERVRLDAAATLRPGALTLPDRKRMELARCLATRPKMLLLDEMMCGLNPTEIAEMIVLLRSVAAEGVTLIVVEHIMEVIAELTDDVVVLAGGAVIARGRPSVVLRNEDVVEAYLGEAYDAVD
jgi:branched-chain amino acid transport system ATP-binding protein